MIKHPREPTLPSIKMIENIIKNNSGEHTRTEIWKRLPKQMMYQTFKKAFDYLVDSHKVIVHERKVIWIYDPELYEFLKERSVAVGDGSYGGLFGKLKKKLNETVEEMQRKPHITITPRVITVKPKTIITYRKKKAEKKQDLGTM